MWQGISSRRYFAAFAWAVLALNIPVILWGAYVRVSFSGDGCGAHWPTCNGQVIPQHMAAPMAIEFTHRVMTGLDTFAVVAMLIWAFRAFPRRHAVRIYSVCAFVFLMIEALLGAGLVLFRLVAKDQSAGRVWYLSAHLTNTMLLLATLTMTAWLARTGTERLRLRSTSGLVLGSLAVTVLVSVTGAIAALGDTLFPASSLAAGVQQDFARAANPLLRLRTLHPFFAILGAAYLIWAAATLLNASAERSGPRRAAVRVIVVTLLQLLAGIVNLSLLAPLAMQLLHLAIADFVWIAVVLMVLEASKMKQRASVIAYAEAS